MAASKIHGMEALQALTIAKDDQVAPIPVAGSYEEYLDRRHFGSLDGLRGICILMVIWHHTPTPTDPPAILTRGFLGVDMFFVLSGFLITTLLLRERLTRGSINLGRFYARRMLRIAPIYYLQLLATGALLFLFRPDGSATRAYIEEFPYLFTYTANFIHIATPGLSIVWSLCVEEQFYLTWPWVERYLPHRVVWMALLVVIAVNQCINFGMLDGVITDMGISSTLHTLDVTFTPIALGVALAHLLHHERGFRFMASLLGIRWVAAAIGIALLLVMSIPNPDISGVHRLSIQLLMCLLIGSLVSREDNSLSGMLSKRPLARIGVISYGLYLYHLWGMLGARTVLAQGNVDSPLVTFALGALLSIIIAEISFRMIEAPFLRIKDRWRA
jgi:peptidoglycan/LPS O-acetylase OafA/YrhL